MEPKTLEEKVKAIGVEVKYLEMAGRLRALCSGSEVVVDARLSTEERELWLVKALHRLVNGEGDGVLMEIKPS